jgi:hypothetical protein
VEHVLGAPVPVLMERRAAGGDAHRDCAGGVRAGHVVRRVANHQEVLVRDIRKSAPARALEGKDRPPLLESPASTDRKK